MKRLAVFVLVLAGALTGGSRDLRASGSGTLRPDARVAAPGEAKSDKLPEVSAPAPSSAHRVTAAAMISPARAFRGGKVTLLVKIRVAPGHHIYALEKSGTVSVPTSIETELPGTLRPEGPWRGPEPKVNTDGSRTLSGDLVFRRRFVVQDAPATQAGKLRIKVSYQVCSEEVCWPPASIPLETEFTLRPSPK